DLAHARPHPGADLLPRAREYRFPPGRYARLWLRLRAQGQGRLVDGADSQISSGPQQSGAGLCADRRAPWPEGGRSRRAQDARQVGCKLSGRAYESRSGEVRRDGATGRRRQGRIGETSRRFSGNPDDVLTHRRGDLRVARRDGPPAWRAQLMAAPRSFRILIIMAALMGGAGVILAAMSAHQADATRLGPASSMLLFHGLAVLRTVALSERGVIHARIGIGAAWGFVIAAALFATDLTLRQNGGRSLF